jgi:hypothetical protein
MIRVTTIWNSSIFQKNFQSYCIGPAHAAALVDTGIERLWQTVSWECALLHIVFSSTESISFTALWFSCDNPSTNVTLHDLCFAHK